MKGLALVLLCVAAAQARSTGFETARNAAALGENPWLVHLRVAVSTSGLLNSCAGSLIDPRWVLTSASCVTNARFVWVRYGTVDVISPQLVTETSAVRVHAGYDAATGENDIALVSLNRHVLNPPNAHIAKVAVATADDELPESTRLCAYGADENDAAGDFLSCVEASLSVADDGSIYSDAPSTKFDLGAPLVSDGVQYGILTSAGENSGFLNPAAYRDWIQQEAGIVLGPGDGDEGEDEDEDEDEDADEGRLVNFVN